jgi:hypothetical protein
MAEAYHHSNMSSSRSTFVEQLLPRIFNGHMQRVTHAAHCHNAAVARSAHAVHYTNGQPKWCDTHFHP